MEEGGEGAGYGPGYYDLLNFLANEPELQPFPVALVQQQHDHAAAAVGVDGVQACSSMPQLRVPSYFIKTSLSNPQFCSTTPRMQRSAWMGWSSMQLLRLPFSNGHLLHSSSSRPYPYQSWYRRGYSRLLQGRRRPRRQQRSPHSLIRRLRRRRGEQQLTTMVVAHGMGTPEKERQKYYDALTKMGLVAVANRQLEIQRSVEPYNEMELEEMVAANKWFDLESYLKRYIPEVHGRDVVMDNASLFLHCRIGQLWIIKNDLDNGMASMFFMDNCILPLAHSNSDKVNPGRLTEKIQFIYNCFMERRQLDVREGVVDAIKGYLKFYLPDEIGYQQAKRLQSEAWRFLDRIEEGSSKGVVQARCLLCQKVLPKQQSVRYVVVDHIGKRECQHLATYAISLYTEKIKDKDTVGTKARKRKVLKPQIRIGLAKGPRVDTPLKSGVFQGDNLVNEIYNDIDIVQSMVDDLCIMSNKESKLSVRNKISEILQCMKTKVGSTSGHVGSGEADTQHISMVNTAVDSTSAHALSSVGTSSQVLSASMPLDIGGLSTVLPGFLNYPAQSFYPFDTLASMRPSQRSGQGFTGVHFNTGTSEAQHIALQMENYEAVAQGIAGQNDAIEHGYLPQAGFQVQFNSGTSGLPITDQALMVPQNSTSEVVLQGGGTSGPAGSCSGFSTQSTSVAAPGVIQQYWQQPSHSEDNDDIADQN